MAEEVNEVVGPKGSPDPQRSAVRHGHEGGEVTLGARRVAVEGPRVCAADGSGEVALKTYRHFADRDPLTAVVLEQMLAGVSTRRFSRTREPVGRAVDLRLEYYERGGGAVAKLAWQTPTRARQIVPNTALTPRAARGVVGEYFAGTALAGAAVTRDDQTIDLDWGTGAAIDGRAADDFRSTGTLTAPTSEATTFILTGDDGVRLYLDGRLVIDAWRDQAPSEHRATLDLQAGRAYDLRREYYERGGGAVAKLAWRTPTRAQQVVPTSARNPTRQAPPRDTSHPDTTITSGPAADARTADAAPSFAFSADVSFERRVDGGAWQAVTSLDRLPRLSDGRHTVEFRATDAAGNVDASPATRTFTVDTTAPETTITGGPTGTTTDPSPSFTFTASEDGSAFRCSVDGAAYEECVSPRRLSELAEGGHMLRVRARETTGNDDASPAERTFQVQRAVSTPAPAGKLWALIGTAHRDLAGQRNAGVNTKVVRVSWKDFEPGAGAISADYVRGKRDEIARLRAAGFLIVLDSGLHDVPAWVHERYQDSYYVNQHGERWTRFTDGDLAIDKGDANLIFNAALREAAGRYLREMLAAFGPSAYAVRVGGGRYNELGYPVARTASHANTYWAFDANAQRQSPVPGWRPGNPTPNGEARRFMTWYLDSLVAFQNWQVRTVREAFAGPVMVLYPSAGLRPGHVEEAIRGNLSGATSAEGNGETQRGYDFERQVRAIDDPDVWVTTTWIDTTWSDDNSTDPRRWSPVKYLAGLARAHTPQLKLYGENTGQANRQLLELSADRMWRHGLEGMAWYREEELGANGWATLNDLRDVIAATDRRGPSPVVR